MIMPNKHKFKTYNAAIEYVQEQESTNISYAKVGSNSKKLIVSFGHNGHDGFARKGSLINDRFNLPGDDSFDILYIRNQRAVSYTHLTLPTILRV